MIGPVFPRLGLRFGWAAVVFASLLMFATGLGEAKKPPHKKPPPLVFPLQLAGKSGCVSATGAGGCSTGRNLGGASSVAVSPDGKNVYVAAGESGIAAFARNPTTGVLTQLPGAQGCISAAGGGCTGARQATVLAQLLIAPDGHAVYARSPNGVVVLTRDAGGVLSQPAGANGCVIVGGAEGCATARGFAAGARYHALALSPDGSSLFMLGSAPNPASNCSPICTASMVLGFTRDPATGMLTQRAGQAGCIAPGGPFGCANTPASESFWVDMIVLGDGRLVVTGGTGPRPQLFNGTDLGYLPSSGDGSLKDGLFNTEMVATSGGSGAAGLFNTARNPQSFGGIYVASFAADPPASVGCLTNYPSSTCKLWPFLDGKGQGTHGLAYTADGKKAVVAQDGVGVLSRAASEQLTPTGCLGAGHQKGCRAARPSLAGAGGIAISPDGRFAYAVSPVTSAVSVIRLR
jgi:DNA-binding beta-propeller fold protein YncE